MKIEKFEDLDVWQEGMRISESIYKALKECRDFGLCDQMQRAAVSIPSNIAEGFERDSNKEYIHFLYYAKASCGELRTQIYLAIKLGVVEKHKGDELIDKTRKISSMLFNLIKTRKENF